VDCAALQFRDAVKLLMLKPVAVPNAFFICRVTFDFPNARGQQDLNYLICCIARSTPTGKSSASLADRLNRIVLALHSVLYVCGERESLCSVAAARPTQRELQMRH
jgi:hypothetical protein